jgi:hypothetical protein
MEAKGRFGKQDFVYLSDEDVYRCPAGEKLKYHYTNEEDGQQLRRLLDGTFRRGAMMPRLRARNGEPFREDQRDRPTPRPIAVR